MQFIPSTWSVVGVDADGDGQRNPQDVDDSALATAVYLCSGGDDLGTTAGQRAAVFRYNHSQAYVDLVLSIMDAYLDGEFTSVPNGVTSAGYIIPQLPQPTTRPKRSRQRRTRWQGHAARGPGSDELDADSPRPTPTTKPTTKPTTQLPTRAPTDDPAGAAADVDAAAAAVDLGQARSTSCSPQVQARAQCLLDGYIDNILKSDDPYDQCVYAYTH